MSETKLNRNYNTRFWRVMFRLFPVRSAGVPEADPELYKEGHVMTTRIIASISWADRLRILISGQIAIEINSRTSVEVTHATSTSVLFVLPPGWKQPSGNV